MHLHVSSSCCSLALSTGVAKVQDANQHVDLFWALTLTQELYCLAFRVGPIHAMVEHITLSLLHLVAFLVIAATIIVPFIVRVFKHGKPGHNGPPSLASSCTAVAEVSAHLTKQILIVCVYYLIRSWGVFELARGVCNWFCCILLRSMTCSAPKRMDTWFLLGGGSVAGRPFSMP